MYNQTVMDHFSHPRNTGTMEDPDGIGTVGNSRDGDKITIQIQVRDQRITQVRFQTFGCGAAIATSSMVTELALGKTLDEALSLTNEEVAQALDGLPPQKLSCSNLAADALHQAVLNYRAKSFEDCSGQKSGTDMTGSFPSTPPSNISQGKLTPEQTTRFLRHIIMPEIKVRGQQILMDTSVLVLAPSVDHCDLTLLYLASCGIGKLLICLDNDDNFVTFLHHLRELNPDTELHVLKNLSDLVQSDEPDRIILTGPAPYLSQMEKPLADLLVNTKIPVLLGMENHWNGSLVYCKDLSALIDHLHNGVKISHLGYENDRPMLSLGSVFSNALLGLLSVNQVLTTVLDIGSPLPEVLSFDLKQLRFDTGPEILWQPDTGSLESDHEDYKQQLLNGRALIIGTGGLGSPAAFLLAKSGLGLLGLADYDQVDLSNLNRQILHSTTRVGMRKTDSAASFLKRLFPETNLVLYSEALSKKNASKWLKDFQVIIDGLDNLPSRYLLNDACYFAAKPYISAGVLTYYGLTTTIIPDDGPCYRCIFPRNGASGQSCAETGVLGSVPGVLGILEALQAVHLILGRQTGKEVLLMYDARESEFTTTAIFRNDSCPLCGKEPSITGLEADYGFSCEDKSE